MLLKKIKAVLGAVSEEIENLSAFDEDFIGQ
jgi:hypothetical protein